jgi:hypothetical protein
MDAALQAYTYFEAGGVWKGDREKSLVFEVLDTTEQNEMRMKCQVVAGFLQNAGNQETVMVTVDHGVELLFFS